MQICHSNYLAGLSFYGSQSSAWIRLAKKPFSPKLIQDGKPREFFSLCIAHWHRIEEERLKWFIFILLAKGVQRKKNISLPWRESIRIDLSKAEYSGSMYVEDRILTPLGSDKWGPGTAVCLPLTWHSQRPLRASNLIWSPRETLSEKGLH